MIWKGFYWKVKGFEMELRSVVSIFFSKSTYMVLASR
jgi:hypothetical protein